MIDDLAEFGSPVMLFSGGEPLMRPDLPELARYAVKKGHAGGDQHQRHPDPQGQGQGTERTSA
jgi:hypothetical protein